MAVNRFDQLIDRLEPTVRKAFVDAIYAMRGRADLAQITAMLERRDVEGALRAVGLDPATFRLFDRSIANVFETGGVATATALPVVRGPDGFRTIVQFSIRNPAAEQWLRTYSAGLVTDILDDQRAMIRQTLTAGLARGDNPRTTALDLIGRIGASGKREGGSLGLTSSQEMWVRNYAEELASENPKAALARTLRDNRFDRAVIKAAESGEPIPAALREKMVTAYKNRALRYRAETIARKETITALHTAQEQAMQQAIASGAISPDAVTYTWHTAHDKRVRDTHRTMDGQVKPMGQPFVTGAGVRLRYPGDELGPPAEVINCRCWREPKVDFLRGVR